MATGNIDFNLYKTFREIYKEKNISKAAKKLGVSQPTVSFSLAKLRSIYQDSLFVQIAKVMEPTPLAEELAASINQGCEIFENTLREKINFDPATSTDTFKIGMSDYSETVILPPLIRYIETEAPSVTIEIKHIQNQDRQKALEEGIADINIHGTIPGFHSQMYSGGIMQTLLFQERYVIVMNNKHKCSDGKITAEELGKLKHARYGADIIDPMLAEIGMRRNSMIIVPHILVLLHIAEQSKLVITIPERLTRLFSPNAEVQILEPPKPMPPVIFHMYWHNRTQKSPGHIWLRQALSKVLERI